jgi:hypothetical protein
LVLVPAPPEPLAASPGGSGAAAYEASLAGRLAAAAAGPWRHAALRADAACAGAAHGEPPPPPRGLPARLVNATAVDAAALREAIADLLQTSPHLQLPPGPGAFWQPADFSGGSGFAAGGDALDTVSARPPRDCCPSL